MQPTVSKTFNKPLILHLVISQGYPFFEDWVKFYFKTAASNWNSIHSVFQKLQCFRGILKWRFTSSLSASRYKCSFNNYLPWVVSQPLSAGLHIVLSITGGRPTHRVAFLCLPCLQHLLHRSWLLETFLSRAAINSPDVKQTCILHFYRGIEKLREKM